MDKNRHYILYWGTILYFSALWLTIHYYHYTYFPLYWLGTLIPLFWSFRSSSVLLETSVMPVLWLVLTGITDGDVISLYLPLFAAVLMMISYRILSRWTVLITIATITLWYVVHLLLSSPRFDFGAAFILLPTVIGIIFYTAPVIRPRTVNKPGNIDLILCSYSGNTAHYAQYFIQGAEREGAEVVIHRFHHYKDFHPNLKGDSLVLAFPVIGWKPPWPLVNYLLMNLPLGNGKPAFILYSAAGGPENAGAFVWLILTLKGYRVMGRLWATYPLNVPTFRLGPSFMWRFLDGLTPEKIDTDLIRRSGEEFTRGRQTGLPFVLWPTPLTFFGYLLDNQFINILLYRTYAWRRRCVSCGLCVRYCPSQRFSMHNGVPLAKGTCALCFGCVNLCPHRAMQMLFCSEYGQPYRPRWPHFMKKLLNQEEYDAEL